MEIAPLPPDESARLQALSEYDVLDTLPELEFDDLTLLASHVCQTPIALISLIDPERQWFKSKVGVEVNETPRDIAFCAHAILEQKTFVVGDAASDPRFADNPLVTKDPHIRFYAGAPLVTKEGHALGTLCVIDRVSRDFDQKAQDALQALARQVMAQLELRRLISSRQAVLEALRESEERFDLAIKGTNDGIWDWMDITQDAEWWSPHFYHLLGYHANEVPASQSKFKEFLHPDDRERTFQAVQDHFEKSEPFDLEYRLRTKSGEYRWFRGRGNTVRDEVGRPLRMAGSIQDITVRREAEEARLILQQAIHQGDEGVALLDNQGLYTYMNPAHAKIYGYTPEELMGRSWRELYCADQIQEVEEKHFPTLQEQGAWRCALVGRKKSGDVLDVEISLTLLKNRQGGQYGLICNCRDVTDRKQKEMEILQQRAELTRSNEDLQQFAAIASHDLQEPLRMVSSYTQLLGQRYAGKLDADADEYITFAIDGANRMQTLIRDLLEYSRVGQGSPHMAMIDSHESLNQALKNLNTLIGERKAKIVTDGLPLLQADATRLTQVFQNLLANAIKFCDPSTTPCITICAEPRERHWFFSVQDNGIGIKSAHVTKIFDVFHRLHNRKAYSGTGIGLAICKRIVEEHGGQIWVESKPGAGATFFFTITR